MPTQKTSLQIIDDLVDIPTFHDEAAEAAFWGTHRLSDALLAQMQPLDAEVAPPARATQSITLRIDPALLARLQALARQRQMPYQRLLKQLLEERLQQLESGDQRAASDPKAIRKTAQSLAKLARDLEAAVAGLD